MGFSRTTESLYTAPPLWYRAGMESKTLRPDAPVPPVLRRQLWWLALPAAWLMVVAALLLGGAVTALVPGGSAWWGVVLPLVVFAPLLLAISGMWLGQRRIRRAVEAAGGSACTHCAADLSAMGPTGACPTCGHGFNAEANCRCWARVGMAAGGQRVDARAGT